jgi:hypothetical protein
MADAIITDVVQEVSRILTASDVVAEELTIVIRQSCNTRKDGTRDYAILVRTYHQRRADSSGGRLEDHRQVDADVKGKWSLPRGNDMKELVSIVLESTNVKAIVVFNDHRRDTHNVIEQFLQGLCTNNTIESASFQLMDTTIDVLDKSADMLCHNIGLKHFSFTVNELEGTTKYSGFGNALKMNHTLQSLHFDFCFASIKVDLEELVQPLIMDENGHQANSTLTALSIYRAMELSTMSPIGATLARMLRKNSSIKDLDLTRCKTGKSDVQELIQSLVENHSLETLNLRGCTAVKGSVFPAIMDVLLVNFTLKDINLDGTPLHREGKGLAIKEQLRRNEMYKVLHLKELEMAKPTSARVIFCGFPYAGMF